MHLPISVTQDELLEVLLQVAPVRPVLSGVRPASENPR